MVGDTPHSARPAQWGGLLVRFHFEDATLASADGVCLLTLPVTLTNIRNRASYRYDARKSFWLDLADGRRIRAAATQGENPGTLAPNASGRVRLQFLLSSMILPPVNVHFEATGPSLTAGDCRIPGWARDRLVPGRARPG